MAPAESIPSYTYTELSNEDQRNAIKARKRDLESQFLQISLRIEAPAMGEATNPTDIDTLNELSTSLQALADLESKLPSDSASG